MLRCVVQQPRRHVLNAAELERLRDTLREEAERDRGADAPAVAKRLRSKLEHLEGQIARWAEGMLDADPASLPGLERA